MKSLGITVLGSGSRGNSILLHSADEGILIDAGFSRKEIIARMLKSNVSPEIIKAILISHEHGDHISGAKLLADNFGIPTYGTSETLKHLHVYEKLGRDVRIFESGSVFNVGSFEIRPFSVPHDAADPVGFVVTCQRVKVGIATDMGHLSALCLKRLSGCDALIIESNHDVEMQKNSERAMHLKRRVLGKHGHLNNDDAMSALPLLISRNTRFLCLSHLSSECNSQELVRKLAENKLAELNRPDILLSIADQLIPLPTVWMNPSEPELCVF